jgi:hypothetical protein
VGALCLSWVGYDPRASPPPAEASGQQDKHKAPSHPRIHPLSLQDGDKTFPILLVNIHYRPTATPPHILINL